MDAPSTRLRLHVSPGASTTAVVGRYGGAWKVRVSAPAEGGRANEAALRLVARAVGVRRRDVALVSGHGAREKLVELSGVALPEAERRLASAGGEDRAR